MKRILYITVLLCVSFLNAQNQIFKINANEPFYADVKKLINSDDKKIKIKFSSLDNGNCFVFNRLLHGNKTGKVLSYFKKYDVVVVRSEYDLSYYTFKEAFPKGGFYKTDTKKIIFGKEATLYAFDNDVLDIRLWVVSGTSEKHEFEKYLKNMGLLENIPKNSSVIAVNIMGVEFDISDFKSTDEKYYKSNLNDVLVSFKEQIDTIRVCRESIKTEEIPLSQIDSQYKLSLDLKVNYIYKMFNSSNEIKNEFQNATYTNKEGTIDLEFYDEPDAEGFTFRLTNRLLKQEFFGSHDGSKLKILKAKTFNAVKCFKLQEKILSQENGIKKTFIGYNHEFGLVFYEYNVKDFPNYKNPYTSNGLITKMIYLDKDLDKREFTSTIENGNFTFTLVK